MSEPQTITGIGTKAVRPAPDKQANIGGKARENNGAWNPLIDWEEVYPGNRGINREGLYDLYDAPVGIRLAVEEGRASQPLLRSETAWEGGGGLQPYGLWQADAKYHLLYGAYPPGGNCWMCYAVSADGDTWIRPALGQVSFQGSTANNIVAELPAGGPGFFIDPTAPPAARFKYMIQEGGSFDNVTGERLSDEEWQKRLRAQDLEGPTYTGPRMVFRHWVSGFCSPDGIHWQRLEKTLAVFPADGGIAPGYDPATGAYFAYLRPAGVGRRAIALTHTHDFHHWPSPRLVLFPDPQDEPDVSFYGANYFAYPGRDDLHGLVVQVYHQNVDTIDNQIAFSRDGVFWQRPERRAIIPLGPAGSGYECMNRAWGGGLVELPDGQWATLHEGVSFAHNFRAQVATIDAFPLRSPGQIRWARWQPHRLCGLEAVGEGRFTIPAINRSQNELRLNYRCQPGGWVKVELIAAIPSRLNPDAEGAPGFTFADCDRLIGDELDRVVTWRGNRDTSAVGETIAVRVQMFQAKLFAYRC